MQRRKRPVIHEIFGNEVGGTKQHSLARIRLPPGKSSAPHYHPVAEESYYILEGHAKVVTSPFVEGEESSKEGQKEETVHLLEAGDAIGIQTHTWHQIWNPKEDQDLVFLAVCTPPWDPQCSVFK
ncbi:Mannose-6-phosphate isomerase [Balamuthia mandrillaris]